MRTGRRARNERDGGIGGGQVRLGCERRCGCRDLRGRLRGRGHQALIGQKVFIVLDDSFCRRVARDPALDRLKPVCTPRRAVPGNAVVFDYDPRRGVGGGLTDVMTSEETSGTSDSCGCWVFNGREGAHERE